MSGGGLAQRGPPLDDQAPEPGPQRTLAAALAALVAPAALAVAYEADAARGDAVAAGYRGRPAFAPVRDRAVSDAFDRAGGRAGGPGAEPVVDLEVQRLLATRECNQQKRRKMILWP